MVVLNRQTDEVSVKPSCREQTARYLTFGEFLIKGLIQKFYIGQGQNLGPETSLAIVGSPAVSLAMSTDSDIVHLHWTCAGLMRPEQLRDLRQKPVIWTLHDAWPLIGIEHYPSGRASDQRMMRLDNWARQRKSESANTLPSLTLVSPSNWLAGLATASTVGLDRRVETISNGVDLTAFKSIPPNTQLGFGSDPVQSILFGSASGTALPRKGFSYLLEALRILAQEWPADSLRLVTFGSNPQEETFESPWPVTALGNITDEHRLAELYNSVDVFVAPSVQENLANTVLESLACGTPVVAFDVGGMPDAIDHMKNGYLATPRDAVDLARGISTILKLSPQDQERFKAEARAKAVRCFDISKQASKYVRLYEEVIEEFKMNHQPSR